MRPATVLIRLLLALFCGLLFSSVALAEEESAPAADPISVGSVLTLGPVELVLPAFHEDEKAGVKLNDLFGDLPLLPGGWQTHGQWPAEGMQWSAPGGNSLKWQALKNEEGNFQWKTGDAASARYLAFYVYNDRYGKAKLTVTTEQPCKVFLDGAALSLSADPIDEEGAPASKSGEMTLAAGKHLVVLRSMYEPAEESETESETEDQEAPAWMVGLSVTPGENLEEADFRLCPDPRRPVDIDIILDAPRIGRTVISPDGSRVLVSMSEYRDGKNRESWLEVRDTKSGKLQNIYRPAGSGSSLAWSPDGKLITWQDTVDGASSIWYFNPEEGESGTLLSGIKDLGGWQWTPDSKSIIYSITRRPDADKRKVKHVLHPADRQSWWRGRSHLMQVFLPDGLTRRLTAGSLSPRGWAVSPDSKQLIFFTGEPDMANRPYSTSEMWLMDLKTLQVEMVLNDPWIGGADWSPDGKTLLLQGSPSAFAGLGRNLPDGMQANDYGGQLYLFDLKDRQPTAISLDLVPDVGWTHWSEADGMIYTRCTDTQYSNIYRYHPGKKTWTKIDTGFEYTNQLAVPRKGSVAVARGTSANVPNKVTLVDLKKNKSSVLLDPNTEHYSQRVLGKVENWATTLENGMELDGFVYYPPMFDPEKKYPVIVYYYGGTSPVTRDFGGRYPKNTWAGQGYIVYVPEPSGATGYGQEFAARHVNDWGILTAGEVVNGTRNFLAAHPYADAEAVGCIGASYGGFLTQYIITQTDLFAAAVSHAGISSISSYWGEGLWGYAYGARALANAFPWQDKELYVEQSPLFHADKITTPLLLVHGDSDTNVPIGESDQLFTALKMMGKEVEYVQVKGQDHWIVDHGQRIVWHDTILSFFAKHLKKRDAWWNAMYPEPEF